MKKARKKLIWFLNWIEIIRSAFDLTIRYDWRLLLFTTSLTNVQWDGQIFELVQSTVRILCDARACRTHSSNQKLDKFKCVYHLSMIHSWFVLINRSFFPLLMLVAWVNDSNNMDRKTRGSYFADCHAYGPMSETRVTNYWWKTNKSSKSMFIA